METLTETEEPIFNIGKEFAFEGMEPSSFKGNTADEYRIFKKGYEEGIRIMQEKNILNTEYKNQEESFGPKK